MADLELGQSFGSTGNCSDNAVVGAFWATRAELRSAVFDSIEGFYNPNRIQRRLGHHSPIDYEEHTAA